MRLVSPRTFAVVAVMAMGAGSAFAQPLARADVDRDCRVTNADVTLLQSALNRRCGQAGFLEAADVNQDCVINNTDATFVVRNIGKTVCTTPSPAPTIQASVMPAANARGWHRDDVVVTFACTNVTSCPAAVTVTTEGVGQVVTRTVTGPGGSATARVTLNIDRTPPSVTTAWPASVLPGSAVDLPVTASDANGVVRTTLYQGTTLLDEATDAPFVLTRNVPQNVLVGGIDVLDVYAEDPAGNAAAVRRAVLVDVPDRIAPDVRLTAPPSAPPGAMVPLMVDASDDRGVARVVVTRTDAQGATVIVDRTAAPFGFQQIVQIPEDATDGTVFTYAALATDTSDNTATATATVTVVTTVDTEALQIAVTPPVSPTFQPVAIISGTIGRTAASGPAPAPPIIAGVSPTTGRQGQALDLTLTGINTSFAASSLVTLGPGVTVLSVTPSSATTLTVRVQIAADATVGPRLVAVQSGQQEALLGSAFMVQPGLSTVTGRLLDADGQPLAGARVCLPSGNPCVITDANGRFTFSGLQADVPTVVASADGYESTTLRVKLAADSSVGLGDLRLAVSTMPPPPPLPTAPPVGPQLAVALGRGAAEVTSGGSPAALEKLVRDTIVAVGGEEIGVLDAEGRQLNPRIVGAGLTSFTARAVEEVARDMIAGDTIGLAEFLKTAMGSLEFPAGTRKPTLLQLLAAMQQMVNDVWADPSRPEAPLVMVLFNQGRVVSATPPQVTFDTRFNALQRDLLVSSFFTFMSTTLPGTRHVADTQGSAGFGLPAQPTRLAYRPQPALGSLDRSWRRPIVGISAPSMPAYQLLPGDRPASDRWSPASVGWNIIMEKSLPQNEWQLAQQGAGLCDKFLVKVANLPAPLPGDSPEGKQAATDPLAKFLPDPSCKDVITLAEMALATKPDYGTIGKSLTTFLTSERVTKANASRIYSSLENAAFQETFAKARAEVMQQSRTLEQAKKFATFGAGLVEQSLTKFQGQAITAIFNLEVSLIVESLRPRAPFIRTVAQEPDPTTDPVQPSRIVKVTFDRSPNDNGNVDSVVWKYYLIRGRSGEETPVAMKTFAKDDATYFFDEVPSEGSYIYRVRAMRVVGSAVIPAHQQTGFEEVLSFLSGIVPSAGTKTPAGHTMLGLDFVKTVTDPLAEIYRGLHVQSSDASDPAPINVLTRNVTRPPANLAVDTFSRAAYLSIPSLDTIFKYDRFGTTLFAQHGFAAPGAIGLGIDSRGFLYTDNGASDARFGGRIFSFAPDTGIRTHVGSTNYYSVLIQHGNPVSVQSVMAAPSPRGEALYIADSYTQRLTLLSLPWRWPSGVDASRNTSQPYITSPLFNFSGSTTMAMRGDDTLAITQYDNLLMVAPGGGRVAPLFDSGQSPFTDLTGVTFDRYQNMYVTDATAGTITMVPLANQTPGFGFFGMDAVQKRRLTVLRGARRPTDVKLAPFADGLAFFDGERAFVSIGFGVSGRLTRPGGDAIAGATVLLPEVNRVAVTDGDGIFVVSDLLAHDRTAVFDVTVRTDGKTQSYVVPLDPFKHNLVDLVFDPPAPPVVPPPGTTPPPVPPPGDRTHVEVTPPDRTTDETVSTKVDITRTGDPPPPISIAEACPRAIFVRPALGAGVATATPVISGWLTSPSIASPVLVVNGQATPLTTTAQDFTAQPTLLVGANTLYVAVRGDWLKGKGCASPGIADDALVSISTTHTVFHAADAAALAAYRATTRFDLSIRGIVRDNGAPLAGISVHVPGTDEVAWTDIDGVFQLDLNKAAMAGRAAGVDAISASLYARAGAIVSLIGNDQRADAIAALEALLAQTLTLYDSPPAAGSAADQVAALAAQVEGVASRLLTALQAPAGIPEQADVDALSALGGQLAGATSDGEIVVRGREYTDIVVKVKVQ